MRFLQGLNWRRGLAWLAALTVFSLAGALLFMASGLYNVSAAVKHFDVTERLIKLTLHRSISFHSDDDDVPEYLEETGLALLGARHFKSGCAPCHGLPGKARNPIVEGMYPAPPDLSRVAEKYTPAELAWIVENGLKFTGMPAWAGHGRRDEVWPLVAYLRQLSATEGGHAPSQEPAGDLPSCAACHGNAARPPVSPMVPSLVGQTADYIERALREYRSDHRQSGMMEPIAAKLGDDEIRKIAQRYATEPSKFAPEPEDKSRRPGRRIVTKGAPGKAVPACLSCHGAAASRTFPRLYNLSRTYILRQLTLFKNGERNSTGHGAVMTAIARRLSEKQMVEAAEYFASGNADTSRSSSAAMEKAR